MTRLECELKLIELAAEMYAVYKEYNPAADYLNVVADKGGYICIEDAFFNADNKIIRDVHGNAFSTVNVTRYKDGDIWFDGGKVKRERESA